MSAPGHAFFDGEDRGDVLAFAHNAVDAGADIVIGQGPHVPRALELYRGHLIAYSLGNFWTYGAIDTTAVRGDGPSLEAWLAPDGTVAGFAIHSTDQHEGQCRDRSLRRRRAARAGADAGRFPRDGGPAGCRFTRKRPNVGDDRAPGS